MHANPLDLQRGLAIFGPVGEAHPKTHPHVFQVCSGLTYFQVVARVYTGVNAGLQGWDVLITPQTQIVTTSFLSSTIPDLGVVMA